LESAVLVEQLLNTAVWPCECAEAAAPALRPRRRP
jgi:hypothetical protein